MYSVSAYFLAKMIADIPNMIIFPALSGFIIYFFLGLSTANFYTFPCFSKIIILNLLVGIIMLIYASGGSLAMIFSSYFSEKQLTLTMVPVIILPLTLFSGFFVSLDSVPFWLQPIGYISLFKYSF